MIRKCHCSINKLRKYIDNCLYNHLPVARQHENKHLLLVCFDCHNKHDSVGCKMSDGSFLLSINGQVEYLDVLAGAGSAWHCRYEFISGTDWQIVSGLEAGLSQIANVVINGAKIVLNLPIEITYKSTNPYGWPQIVLSVYNNMNLQGYGRIHVPLQPGVHRIDVPLSKPLPSSLLGYFGTFFGYQPELLQPKMLATTAGNNLIRMISSGSIRIALNILTQNVQSLGYDVGSVR